MSVDKEALRIDPQAPIEHVAYAVQALQRGAAVVHFHGMVEIYFTDGELRGDVIDPESGAHRCEEEFKVLVENAARLLEQTELGAQLRLDAMRWRVVRTDGDRIHVLWPARQAD